MAGAFLAVREEGWRVTITGDFSSGPMPTGYISKLRRFDGAIRALCESEAGSGTSDEQNEPLKQALKEAAAALHDTEDEYIPWPSTGTVTSKEIAAAWIIGESTWKQKVYAGEPYPQPLEVESMRKLWDVQEVTKVLSRSGVQRRRALKICEEA